MIGKVSTTELVFDPALQCRVGLDQDTVDEYAEAMAAGEVFPPITAFRVDGQLLVVDGWHRGHAASQAKLTEVEVDVRDGNRREAMLAAIKANARHGLKRSREDKRRAIVALLQDAEWCAMSSRDLGELAGVSHAAVNNLRKHFRLKRGGQLTNAILEHIDGIPSKRWQALLNDQAWCRGTIESIRLSATLEEIDKAAGSYFSTGSVPAAITERLYELANGPWPWPEDDDLPKSVERCAVLDTVEDLEAAIASAECPDRLGLMGVWRVARSISSLGQYAIDRHTEKGGLFHGRPALMAQAEAVRQEELDKIASTPPSNWEIARNIGAAPNQVDAINSAPAAALDHVRAAELSIEGREAFRERLGTLDVETANCPDPRCCGWYRSAAQSYMRRCVLCQGNPEDFGERAAETLSSAGQLLRHPGYTIESGQVLVDAHALRVLDLLVSAWNRESTAAWVGSGPDALVDALSRYMSSVEGARSGEALDGAA